MIDSNEKCQTTGSCGRRTDLHQLYVCTSENGTISFFDFLCSAFFWPKTKVHLPIEELEPTCDLAPACWAAGATIKYRNIFHHVHLGKEDDDAGFQTTGLRCLDMHHFRVGIRSIAEHGVTSSTVGECIGIRPSPVTTIHAPCHGLRPAASFLALCRSLTCNLGKSKLVRPSRCCYGLLAHFFQRC